MNKSDPRAQNFRLGAYLLGALILVACPSYAQNQNNTPKAESLDKLLQQVQQGMLANDAKNRQREQRFRRNRNQQRTLLTEIKKELAKLDRQSSDLERLLEKNQRRLNKQKEQLNEALGSLKELFGHLTSVAGDLRGTMATSLISAQYPGREAFLTELIQKISNSEQLPSVKDLERLWFEMQREMTESGKVTKFSREVSMKNGEKQQLDIVRIGAFNMTSEKGKYLGYAQGKLEELPRQPGGSYNYWAAQLAKKDSGYSEVGIDPTGPTGGSFLSALIDSPTLVERWHHGGIIGYIITGIGIFAILLASWRMLVLMRVSRLVKSQLKNTSTPKSNNPLGRVLAVHSENTGIESNILELKIDEAVIKEIPKLESGLALLKIIAGIAPLMGLLGTVTGMILTFNGIVIFGAGDPKAMAGGISQALVTTVLGLLVAIPSVLMHTVVGGRSRQIIQVLEEQSAGIVAEEAEKPEDPYQYSQEGTPA